MKKRRRKPKKNSGSRRNPRIDPSLRSPAMVIAVSSRKLDEKTVRVLGDLLKEHVTGTFIMLEVSFDEPNLIQFIEKRHPVLLVGILDEPEDDPVFAEFVNKSNLSRLLKDVTMITFPHLVTEKNSDAKNSDVLRDMIERNRPTKPIILH